MNPRSAGKENRLARSTSPYLLQHRFNPVDWHPWGEEAFAEARRRDVPIFLSVGYSTCYWCHVMERESFENIGIAGMMNEHFVCVKLDREERPDIDDVYMAAVQAFSGRGGWPMSVFLEPQSLEPFWAGTYYPATQKFAGVPTFPQVLQGVSRAWVERREEVLKQAQTLGRAVQERVAERAQPVALSEAVVQQAAAELLRLHDRTHGGFGTAPKFPQPVFLELLLDVRDAAADEATRVALDAAICSGLDAMALGGVFDQVGGGFHRYSVDERWRVPHFEKMLYDNAQLLALYTRAAGVYADAFYARVADRTADYLLREMTSPWGGLYAAQDAEVDHREGLNYLWTREQIERVLDGPDAELAVHVYGLAHGPNFRDPHHPGDPPANVLCLASRPDVLARERGIDEAALLEQLGRINAALLRERENRKPPATDTKLLAGWNGLAMHALALHALERSDAKSLGAARGIAQCVIARMISTGPADAGGLLRSLAARTGEDPIAHTSAFLEDYAMLAHGLLMLARACSHVGEKNDADGYVHHARRLVTHARERFSSPSGGYFDTPSHTPDLFVRPQSVHDGALPSGVSVLLGVLIDLARTTGDSGHLQHAAIALRAVSGEVERSILGATGCVRALLKLLRSDRELVRRTFAGLRAFHADDGHAPIDDPVEVFAEGDAIELAPGEAATIMLRLKIAQGYHVNAAHPGATPAALSSVPLRVHVVGGTGLRVYADYPAGEAMGDAADRVNVYAGEVDIQAVVERPIAEHGEDAVAWSGTPLIAVTYQACRDDACLPVRTVELDVSIDRK